MSSHIFGLYDLLGPRVAEECRKRNIPYVVEPIGMFVPIVRNIWLKRVYHRLCGQRNAGRAGRHHGHSRTGTRGTHTRGACRRESLCLRQERSGSAGGDAGAGPFPSSAENSRQRRSWFYF